MVVLHTVVAISTHNITNFNLLHSMADYTKEAIATTSYFPTVGAGPKLNIDLTLIIL